MNGSTKKQRIPITSAQAAILGRKGGLASAAKRAEQPLFDNYDLSSANERDANLVASYCQCGSVRDVADAFELTPARVGQILAKHRRKKS